MRSGLLSRLHTFACRTHYSKWVVAAVLSGGLTTPANGQDAQPRLGEVQQFRGNAKAPVQFYSKSGQGSATPASQPAQLQTAPVKNYYSELFSNQTQTQPQAASRSVQTIPTSVETTSGAIQNAEYQAPATKTQQVVPVSNSELPVWARDIKSRNQPAAAATPPIQPTSAALPVLNIPQTVIPATQTAPEMPTGITEQPLTTAPVATPSGDESTTGSENLGAQTVTAAGPQTPSVKIEWTSTDEINVGQECECELIVANAGSSTAFGVNVESVFPAHVRLLDADPKPQSATGSLVWQLGQLEEDEVRRIKIKFIPGVQGPLAATAQVRFTGAAQASFVVREPLIELNMEGPSSVMIGDPASQSVTITNPGNGIAKNVRLEAIIPAGLEHTRGERLIMEVGSLNPGEARTIRLALAAVAGGSHSVKVAASADGGLLKTQQTDVSVVAPSLQTEITGPGLRYKGRAAEYTVHVTNDGTVGTSNVRLMHKIPEGFTFVSASRGANYDAPTRILSWFVGKLDAGKASEMKVELMANKIGDHVHFIRATSEHGSTVDAQLTTRVEGASALMLEIVDLDDPVEVGNETAYEIKILNEGSAAAQNVGLTCELPAGVRFVKASGPSQHVADGNMVLFKPQPTIAAGKSATYRVHVVGDVEGNLRFRARMTSATSTEPLTFEELTRFYGDQR